MKNVYGRIAALLLPLAAVALMGCGSGEGGGGGEAADAGPTVVEHPPVRGWMQVAMPQGVEFAVDVQGDDLWMLAGGATVLHNSGDTGQWKSYGLEELPGAMDIAAADGRALVLGADRLVGAVDGRVGRLPVVVAELGHQFADALPDQPLLLVQGDDVSPDRWHVYSPIVAVLDK